VPLLVLVVAELIARTLAVVEGSPGYVPAQIRDYAQSDPGLQVLSSVDALAKTLVPDDDLLWRNRPNADLALAAVPGSAGTTRIWKAHIGERGFRIVRAGAPAATSLPYRVLCIGDSVTFGINVDDSATWPAALLARLEQRFPGRAFDVINAAVPGWSWVQGARFLVRDGFALHPDLVIVAHGTADQFRPVTITDSERIWLDAQPPVHWWNAVREVAAHSRILRALAADAATPEKSASPSPACRQRSAVPGRCRRVPLEEIESAIHEIAESTRATGVDVMLLNLDFRATPASQAFARAVDRDNLASLDIVQQAVRERVVGQARQATAIGLVPPRVPVIPRGAPSPEGVLDRGPRIRLRVKAPPAAKVVSVRGRAVPDGTFLFDSAMNDAGTDGDEKAGDGIFSLMLQTPFDSAGLRYQYVADGKPEFTAPRESPDALDVDRTIEFNRDADGPVEAFGARDRMTDSSHPDTAGHQIIGRKVENLVEQMPTFRTAMGLPLATTPPRPAARRAAGPASTPDAAGQSPPAGGPQ